jgi:hypothetical protein
MERILSIPGPYLLVRATFTTNFFQETFLESNRKKLSYNLFLQITFRSYTFKFATSEIFSGSVYRATR